MKLNELASKMKFKLIKNSPQILVVTGTIGVVASAVMACRATRKIDKILEEHKKEMEVIHDHPIDKEYSESERNKDTAITYGWTAMKLVKLYAPSVILGAVSLGCILKSNDILNKRNAALTAAYAAVNNSFKEYRNRVVERFGEEVDQQLKCNKKIVEIEETETDEKGKEKTVKKSVEVADPMADGSSYMKYFTRSNPNWQDDKDYVEMFLRAIESSLNDRLRIYKFISLNEVYKELGFNPTKGGMVCGWIYDEDHPTGDNYIHFIVNEVLLPNDAGKFEFAYSVDFNVDGDIYSLMK